MIAVIEREPSQAMAKVENHPPRVQLGPLTADNPLALVKNATAISDVLKDIIQRQGLATNIQGKQYVTAEGWGVLGTLCGVLAREVSTTEPEPGNFIAVVELCRMADGQVISRASAECGKEPPWNKRPNFARRSMAQTRAAAKAHRLAFSWVMGLAGYASTPAEEMEAAVHQEPAPTRPTPPPPASPKGGLSDAQLRLLGAKIKEAGAEREAVKAYCKTAYGVESSRDLTGKQLDQLLAQLPHIAFHQPTGSDKQAQAPTAVSADLLRALERRGWKPGGPPDDLDTALLVMKDGAASLRRSAAMADDPSAGRRDRDSASALEKLTAEGERSVLALLALGPKP